MNEKDLRVVKSRMNICKSFMELLREKPLQEINVKDICDRAMCSRNTFYLHFPYKESVLEYLNKQCADTILSGLSNKVDFFDEDGSQVIWKYTENIIQKTEDARELLTFLTQYDKSNLSSILSDRIYDYFIQAAAEFSSGKISEEYLFYCKYIAAGLVSFLISWIEHPEVDKTQAQKMLYAIHGKPIETAAHALTNE